MGHSDLLSRLLSARGPENNGRGVSVTGENLVSDGVRRFGGDVSPATLGAKRPLLKSMFGRHADDGKEMISAGQTIPVVLYAA